MNDVVRAAKALGVDAGFGWNKIGIALSSLVSKYLLEHTVFSTLSGYEEAWRDSTYTLEVLKDVHKEV